MHKIERFILAVAIVLILVFIGVAANKIGLLPTPAVFTTAQRAPSTPTAYVTPTPRDCSYAVTLYREDINDIFNRWDDAAALANSSPRLSLPPQIATLQEIHREMNAVRPSLCTELIHRQILGAMDKTIVGYIAFLGQEPDEVVNLHFTTAADMLERATQEMDRIDGD